MSLFVNFVNFYGIKKQAKLTCYNVTKFKSDVMHTVKVCHQLFVACSFRV